MEGPYCAVPSVRMVDALSSYISNYELDSV